LTQTFNPFSYNICWLLVHLTAIFLITDGLTFLSSLSLSLSLFYFQDWVDPVLIWRRMKEGEGDDGSSSDGTDHESFSSTAQSNSKVSSSTNGKPNSGVS